MEVEKKQYVMDPINREAERIRDIFANSFHQSDGDLDRLLPKNFTETMSQRAAEPQRDPEDEFDWSITLANVESIVDAANAARESALAAERRAEIAEAKAAEALHWLKMLHKAVLKGLPPSTA